MAESIGSYSPTAPTYSPTNVSYSPTAPTYSPSNISYIPTSPHYSPFACIGRGRDCGQDCDSGSRDHSFSERVREIYVTVYRRRKDIGDIDAELDSLQDPPLKKRKLNYSPTSPCYSPTEHEQLEVFKYVRAIGSNNGTAYSDENLRKIGIAPDSLQRFDFDTLGAIEENSDTLLYYTEEFRGNWDVWSKAREHDIAFREKYLCRFVCRQCKPGLEIEEENNRLRQKRVQSTGKTLSDVLAEIQDTTRHSEMPQEMVIFKDLLADMITE